MEIVQVIAFEMTLFDISHLLINFSKPCHIVITAL